MPDMELLPADFLKTFIRHVKMLRFIGLDIFHDNNISFIKKYFRFCVFNVLFIPMVVGQVMYIILGGSIGATFLDVANAVPTTFLALQDAVKMIVVFYKRNEIKHVIMGISEIWPTQIASNEKKTSFLKLLRYLKIMDDTFYISSIIFVMFYEMVPLLITEYNLYSGSANSQYLYPLQCYFMKWLTAHWQYAIGYCYLLTTSVTTHMALYISSDFLLITLTFNLSSLMDLLSKDLEDAVSNYNPHARESIEQVKAVVARHQMLLRLAEELNKIFGLLVFVQVSFSSVVICCFGFFTVIAEGMLLNNMLAGLGVVFAIFNLCWPGQLLANTSFSVSEAAYRSEWYNKDVALRKYIAIIMNRAQKPCHLTALGFSTLQLANFSKILSTSWSYLSLLTQMYQKIQN